MTNISMIPNKQQIDKGNSSTYSSSSSKKSSSSSSSSSLLNKVAVHKVFGILASKYISDQESTHLLDHTYSVSSSSTSSAPSRSNPNSRSRSKALRRENQKEIESDVC